MRCWQLVWGACLFVLVSARADAVTFNVALDSGQEVPAPNLMGATPSGSATVEVKLNGDVTVNGSYAGMTSNVTAAHIHGLAPPGVPTGVIFGFTTTGGTSGTFSGSNTISATQLEGLLNGQTYLNIHTANNGPGEIRGQVVDPDIIVYQLSLDAGQEVPAPNLNGAMPSGSATVVVDTSTGEVEISGSYSGLTTDATAAHLHGLAPAGVATGVIFPLTISGGTSGTFSGSSTLTPDNLTGLLDGLTYINLHTSQNGGGEIRAQVPEPSAIALTLGGAVLFLVWRRRRRSA